MIVIDNGDAIRGIAEVASKLDFIVNGYVGTTATQLADGQLSDSEANLYASGANATVVTSITVVNTDTAARTFTLYLKPSAGTSRAITPVSLDLPVSYSFYTDGQRALVMSTGGAVVQAYSLHAPSHTDGTDDIQDAASDGSTKGISTFDAQHFTLAAGVVDLNIDDTPVNGETDEPITSNWAFDHNAATTGVHGAGANTILYSDHTADADAHGEPVVTCDTNSATADDLAFSIVGGEGIDTSGATSVVTVAAEAASTTNIGAVELATGTETNTGTSTILAVTPDGLDDWTGSAQITTVGTLSSGDVTAQVSAATDSAAGKSELAIASEVNTGTDTGRAVTPDALAGSIFGEKIIYIKVLANDTALTTGDGKAYITVPDALNGMNLVDADIAVYTTSSSGNPTVQLNNLDYSGGAQDMLSTLMTIDAGGTELSSYTAATPPVINGTYDDVATGDRIRVDVDAAGTGTKGLDVILTFRLP